MRQTAIPAGQIVDTADQRIVLDRVSWRDFEVYQALRGDSPRPRVAYLGGRLELMNPSFDHERIKSMIGCLVEVYALHVGIPFTPLGSWTLKKAIEEAGAEPDECYLIGPDQGERIPDLVIEVEWTSGGLDKLEIYRRLGIGEVWRWRAGRIEVHVLRDGRHVREASSRWFPDLDLDLLVSLLDRPSASEAIRAFRAILEATR